MVNDGWPGLEPGSAGESTAVRWPEVLRWMRKSNPDVYQDDIALLAETPITITARHVRDEWSTLPLLYPLADATSPDDLGARLSLVLLDQLPGMGMAEDLRQRYSAAVTRFMGAANHPAVRHTYRLRTGDIAILDNNRYGHGRLPFPETQQAPDGSIHINPRELWSVVVG